MVDCYSLGWCLCSSIVAASVQLELMSASSLSSPLSFKLSLVAPSFSLWLLLDGPAEARGGW